MVMFLALVLEGEDFLSANLFFIPPEGTVWATSEWAQWGLGQIVLGHTKSRSPCDISNEWIWKVGRPTYVSEDA